MEKENSRGKSILNGQNRRCPLCPKVFTKLTYLQRHISSHTKEKSFKCDHCDFTTVSQTNFKRHVDRNHEDEAVWEKRLKFKCEWCSYKTDQPCSLRIHVITHSEDKKFHCKFNGCDYKAKDIVRLNYHDKWVHNQQPLLPCQVPGCVYVGIRRSDLRQHMIKHSEDRPFACFQTNCSYRAKSRNALNVHVRFTHGDQWYSCPLPDCNFKTRHLSSLKTHGIQHVDTKNFKCTFPNCAYRSKTIANLKYHLSRHSGIQPYACPVPHCSYRTVTQSTLKQHMKRHCEDRPFACALEGCGYRAKLKSVLKVHQERHNKERNHPCPITGCPYVARHKADLGHHVKLHDNYQEFRSCPEPGCIYSTRDSNSYWKHQKLHDRRRKYPCPFCPKFFETKYKLEFHSFIHTGEKPYKCVRCDFGCHARNLLAGHYEKTHQGEIFCSEWLKPIVKCRHCSFAGSSDAIGRHTALEHSKLIVSIGRIQIKFPGTSEQKHVST